VGRVLGMVVGSLHRIIGCVGELLLLVIFPCFVVQNNRGADNLAKPGSEPTLPPEIGPADKDAFFVGGWRLPAGCDAVRTRTSSD